MFQVLICCTVEILVWQLTRSLGDTSTCATQFSSGLIHLLFICESQVSPDLTICFQHLYKCSCEIPPCYCVTIHLILQELAYSALARHLQIIGEYLQFGYPTVHSAVFRSHLFSASNLQRPSMESNGRLPTRCH